MNAGIDYGMGQTNVDQETGIRFGVINQNKVIPDGWVDILNLGEDLSFQSFKEQLVSELQGAIEGVLSDYTSTEVSESDVEEFLESIDAYENYESHDDNPRYLYEQDGYKIETCSDGDWFVLKSLYYTKCQFCSPCAPGAGYLMSPTEDGIKAYCLGHEWFEDGAPYPVYRVEDDSIVTE